MKKYIDKAVKFVIIDGKVYEVKKDKSGKRYIEIPGKGEKDDKSSVRKTADKGQ